MTAYSPLTASPASNLPQERLPDPGAIKAAQRETRRLLDMSRGILQAAVGAACLVLAMVYLQIWWPIEDSTLTVMLPLIILGSGMFTQQLVMRARKKAGVPSVSLGAQNQTSLRKRWMVGAFLVLGLVVGFSLVFMPDDIELPFPGTLPFTLFVMVAAVPMAWRGVQLGLWEDVLTAVGIPAGFALMMLQPGTRGIGWLCLGLGLTELIAGYSLHRRWQAWVKSLPKSPEQDSAGAGVSA